MKEQIRVRRELEVALPGRRESGGLPGLLVVVVVLPADPGVLLPVLVLTEGPAVPRHSAPTAGLRGGSPAVPAGLETRIHSVLYSLYSSLREVFKNISSGT